MLTILTSLMKNKLRLYIEYAMIALLVVTAGITFTLWLQKQTIQKNLAETKVQLTSVESRLTTAEQVNKIQQDHIVELHNLRLTDAKVLDGLMHDYKSIKLSSTKARSKVTQLEHKNETVKTYLDKPIPSELGCMFSKTCQPDPIGTKADQINATGTIVK